MRLFWVLSSPWHLFMNFSFYVLLWNIVFSQSIPNNLSKIMVQWFLTMFDVFVSDHESCLALLITNCLIFNFALFLDLCLPGIWIDFLLHLHLLPAWFPDTTDPITKQIILNIYQKVKTFSNIHIHWHNAQEKINNTKQYPKL